MEQRVAEAVQTAIADASIRKQWRIGGRSTPVHGGKILRRADSIEQISHPPGLIVHHVHGLIPGAGQRGRHGTGHIVAMDPMAVVLAITGPGGASQRLETTA
jgi:hypothetical protein